MEQVPQRSLAFCGSILQSSDMAGITAKEAALFLVKVHLTLTRNRENSEVGIVMEKYIPDVSY